MFSLGTYHFLAGYGLVLLWGLFFTVTVIDIIFKKLGLIANLPRFHSFALYGPYVTSSLIGLFITNMTVVHGEDARWQILIGVFSFFFTFFGSQFTLVVFARVLAFSVIPKRFLEKSTDSRLVATRRGEL